MKQLSNNVGSIEQDNLIARLTPAAETFGIVIEKLVAEATIKRGTLLCKGANGKYSAYTGSVATEEFNGDGSGKTFTLTGKPAAVSGVVVGTEAAVIDDYNAYTGVITLHTAPAAGTKNVKVTYNTGSVPSAILTDDVTVGTTYDETAVAYRSGNFSRQHIVLPTGYTLTASDEDELRKYDIIFTDTLKA